MKFSSDTLFIIKKALAAEIARLEKLCDTVALYEAEGNQVLGAILKERVMLQNAVTDICKVYEAQFAVSNPG